MNISNQSERFTEERQNASQESSNIRNSTPLKTNETTNYPTTQTEQKKLDNGISNKFASDISMQNHQDMAREYNGLSPIVNESRMNDEAVPCNTAPSIGQDL